jgi:hypothetical protein
LNAPSTTRGRWRRWLWGAGLVVALAAAALGLPAVLAGGWLLYEERAWSRDDPGATALLAGREPEAANDTARRLTELARVIGVDLRGLQPSDTDLDPLIESVEDQKHATDDGPGGAPLSGGDLLERHRAALDAVETLLAGAEPPAWPRDLRRLYATPIPPVIGVRALNALLLARAVERDRGADPAGALRALTASARLDLGLRDRPETLAQLGALALAEARAGVLRRLDAPPTGWAERMGAHDFRRTLLATYPMEARLQAEYMRSRSFAWRELLPDAKTGPPAWADRLVTTPYAWWVAADTSRRMRRLAARLRETEPCRLDPAALDEQLARDVPRANIVARQVLRQAAYRWTAVRDVELDEELTRIVLEARARPPAEADTVASRVCAGLRWNRIPDGSGGIEVTAEGVRPPARGGRSAWRYHVKAAPVVAPPSLTR